MDHSRNKLLYLILAPLLVAGCATTSVSIPELAGVHPANPDAPAAPLMSMSQTLQSSGISSTPSDAQPATSMQGMEHGSLSGMEHGSMKDMKGMEKDSMEGMEHGDMNKMDQTKSSGKTPAKEPMKGMEKGSMEGMEHGSMQGMDGMNDGAASPEKEDGQ